MIKKRNLHKLSGSKATALLPCATVLRSQPFSRQIETNSRKSGVFSAISKLNSSSINYVTYFINFLRDKLPCRKVGNTKRFGEFQLANGLYTALKSRQQQDP